LCSLERSVVCAILSLFIFAAMPHLMFGISLALVCDAARIAVEDARIAVEDSTAEFFDELSEDEQHWTVWAHDHIHPGTGDLVRHDGPSSLMEAEASVEGPGANEWVGLFGQLLEPGSRQMFTGAALVRRRRSRQSDSVEGPLPTCPDKPECAELIETASLNCSTDDQRNCPTSCNTRFTDAHCIETMSPCSEAISECKHGYRPAAACVPFFSYENELHDGCMHGGPRGRRVWCPHTFDASTAEDQSSSCDECTEVPAASQLQADFEPIAKKLRCIEMALAVGNGEERKYTFQNRGKHFNEQQPFASGGKWPAAVSLAAAVHRGFLEWDTLASDIFSWWTKDAADPRSRVTFRHLLNFNSGFYIQAGLGSTSHQGFRERCLTPGFALIWTPVACAEQIYNSADFAGEPGRYFDYNSYHLQVAFGMVLQASGMEAREWLRVTLLEPVGMTDTYWVGGRNPLLSGGFMSTGNDHEAFLRKYLAYEILPKEIIDVVETEVKMAQNLSMEYSSAWPRRTWAMGHIVEGDCHRMDGMVSNCVNRGANYYIAAYPPLDNYYSGFEWLAVNWIKEEVARAVRI